MMKMSEKACDVCGFAVIAPISGQRGISCTSSLKRCTKIRADQSDRVTGSSLEKWRKSHELVGLVGFGRLGQDEDKSMRHVRNLNGGDALKSRDALAKEVYKRIFTWIVDKVR